MFTEWKSKASLSYLHCFSVLARRSTTSLWGTWGSSRAPLTRAVSFMCVLLTLSPSRLADHPTLDQLFPSVPPSLVPFFPSALLLYFKARRSRGGEGSERFKAGGVILEGGKNNSLFIHFLCPRLTSTLLIIPFAYSTTMPHPSYFLRRFLAKSSCWTYPMYQASILTARLGFLGCTSSPRTKQQTKLYI